MFSVRHARDTTYHAPVESLQPQPTRPDRPDLPDFFPKRTEYRARPVSMLTIFSSPRPFVDNHTEIIQRNAIESWIAIDPRPQVLLIGNDYGIADVAREYSLIHIEEVEVNKQGIPLRSSMCVLARDAAEYECLCLINSDIIFLSGLQRALEKLQLPEFLAAGRRHDLDVIGRIDFDDLDWQRHLKTRIEADGILHGPSAVDYVIYPQTIRPPVLPPFAMNGLGWDSWFLYEHKRRGIPVIDLTPVVTVIHQNHEARSEIKEKHWRWRVDPEAMRDLKEIGGFESMMTLREADFQVDHRGMVRSSGLRKVLARLATNLVYRKLMALKRSIQRLLAYRYKINMHKVLGKADL